MKRLYFKEDAEVIKEGDFGDCAYIVEAGRLEVSKTIEQNNGIEVDSISVCDPEDFIEQTEIILKDLGMPNARLNIELSTTTEFLSNGSDKLEWFLAANKGGSFKEIKKASTFCGME